MSTDLRRITVPYLGRMIVIPALLAHAFALAGLVGYWQQYRSSWAAAGVFIASLLLPFALARASRRAGGQLPAGLVLPIAAGVFAVSAGVPALLPPSARGTLGAWNWGTGAMTLLGLALFVPITVTLWLSAAHGILSLVVVLAAGSGPWTAHLVVVAAIVPPLAAAQYMRFYAGALQQRAAAVAGRLDAEAGRRELDVVRLADGRRLGALREEIEPLLAYVADSSSPLLDTAHADAARVLAERLREVLAAQRQALWLPDGLGQAALIVVSSDAAVRAAGDSDRAWLGALVDLLGRHPGWRRARLVLDAAAGGLSAVLTAEGPAAADALADARVRALCAGRAVRLDREGDLFVVDAELLLTMKAEG